MRKTVTILFSLIILSNLYALQVSSPYGSIYTQPMEDNMAVWFTPENFNIKADGSMDVSDALQEAINRVQETVRYGIVFIPQGTYHISKTIHLWKGVRLIGYGNKRPEIVLGKNTPGFSEAEKKYMIHFTTDRPRGERPVQDANAGTFYSGLRNINLRIEEGNPSAIGIRFHAAQHCFLSHMDFYLSSGTIGVEDICNEIEFCRFYGGKYAIRTGKTAPGWQTLIIDSKFEKQQEAAILTHEAGMMIIRNQFTQMPTAVAISPNRPENLWISDSHFVDITKEAITIHEENNARTQINVENLICRKVPVFASFPESGKKIEGTGAIYQVKDFTYGLQYADLGAEGKIETSLTVEPLKRMPLLPDSDIYQLPDNGTWINLKKLGAKGDGFTDDTDILEKAIAEYETIYLPTGHYRVTRPVILKQNTNLVGLHPSSTQILIRDSTEAFQGGGTPVPLLEIPQGGENIVTGLGLNTSGVNPRAVAAKWMGGKRSMMNDVKFTGGHGTYGLYGNDIRTYNDNRTSDGIPYRKWDTQYWSLWITDGGGGTFKDLWTASPYASAGMYISNTETEGNIYFISIEHHVRNEVIIDRVANWRMFGLQLETESGEGPECLPLEIKNSRDLLLVNTYTYRVSRVINPVRDAIRTENSKNIVFKGIHTHSWTKFSFDNSLYDVSSGIQIRAREIALLNLKGNEVNKTDYKNVERLAGGFYSIDGITTDRKGNIYFVDSHWQRIYCWTTDNQLKEISNLPISPVSLAIDEQDHLIVVCRFVHVPSIFTPGNIHVVTFDPADPENTLRELKETRTGSTVAAQNIVMQTSRYRNENQFPGVLTRIPNTSYVSKSGKTVLLKTGDIGQTIALQNVMKGDVFYVAAGAEHKTYRCEWNAAGTEIKAGFFANEGEYDVKADKQGNVYIPAGNIRVYGPDGTFREEIGIPERPSCIIFGGENGNELFICARTSLYRVVLK